MKYGYVKCSLCELCETWFTWISNLCLRWSSFYVVEEMKGFGRETFW